MNIHWVSVTLSAKLRQSWELANMPSRTIYYRQGIHPFKNKGKTHQNVLSAHQPSEE